MVSAFLGLARFFIGGGVSLVWAGFPQSTGSEGVVGVLVMGLGAWVWVSEAEVTIWGGIGAGAGLKLLVSAGKEAVTRWCSLGFRPLFFPGTTFFMSFCKPLLSGSFLLLLATSLVDARNQFCAHRDASSKRK